VTMQNVEAAREAAPERLGLGRERLIGAGVVALAVVVLLLAAQIHRWIAPEDADGAVAEIVPVLIGGALGWAIVFGAVFIAPHRAEDPARISRRYALGLGIFAVPVVVVAYWTPIPWCLGVGALLLVRRARSFGEHRRSDRVATALAWLAIGAPLLIFVGVIVAALG
jgi:hypothetical protein